MATAAVLAAAMGAITAAAVPVTYAVIYGVLTACANVWEGICVHAFKHEKACILRSFTGS
jgi:hypothetical protein